MELDIQSPDTKIYSGQVKQVQLPGTNGSFGILKNHAPLISTLSKGQIRVIDTNNDIHTFEVSEGVVEVLKNRITVLIGSV